MAELRVAVEHIQTRLDMQLKTKLLTLLGMSNRELVDYVMLTYSAQKGAIAEEMEVLDGLLSDLNRQMADAPKASFVKKSDEYVSMLQEVRLLFIHVQRFVHAVFRYKESHYHSLFQHLFQRIFHLNLSHNMTVQHFEYGI